MTKHLTISYLAVSVQLAALLSGCSHNRFDYVGAQTPAPLGTVSDLFWQRQEENAEASDFVIHEHEFVSDTVRLNRAGEEHLMSIASRAAGTPFPIVVETSSMNPPVKDPTGAPVNGNSALDDARRELVILALQRLGVDDAEQRVVVAPAMTPGFEGFEAERAIHGAFSNRGGFGIFGGGLGGSGFGGGLGGF